MGLHGSERISNRCVRHARFEVICEALFCRQVVLKSRLQAILGKPVRPTRLLRVEVDLENTKLENHHCFLQRILETRPSDTITIGESVAQMEEPIRLIGLASAECPTCHGTYVEVDESRLAELLT